MKTIKIKICGHDPKNQFSYGYPFIRALEKYYHLEFSNNPDYLITNDWSLEYLNYDCVRIFYTGENEHPDYNLFDYAISFDYIDFGDRHFRFPVHQMAVFYNPDDVLNAGDLDFKTPRPFSQTDLNKKSEFCSFVYSNYLAEGTRDDFFNILSKYKQVNSGGRYKNNVGGPVISKLEFEKKHKFSIAFENSSREGYTTEKIFCALAADTVPIYFGDPRIGEIFNERRFVNVMKYPTLESAAERIREIDQNDQLYISMMNEPVLKPGIDLAKDREEFALFLKQIIDQPIEEARRVRINPARQKMFAENKRIIARTRDRQQKLRSILAFFYQPLKRFKKLEETKVALLRKLKL